MTTPGSPTNQPPRTVFPTVAGILMIVVGAIHLMFGIIVAAVSGLIGTMAAMFGLGMLTAPFIVAIGAPLMVLGLISLIGGVYALNRRAWGMALAGSICSLVPPVFTVIGVVAIVFVVLSQKEFT